MQNNLLEYIKDKKYVKEDETIIIALSGGVDSMVLFNILYALYPNIVIAHVNHNKRDASFDEFEEIKRIAKHKNVPFEGMIMDEIHGNFHDESRNKRFNFFKKTALKYNSKKIFLAHHADDQLETILMRITRGSSFTGYAGIKEHRVFDGIDFIRPLMEIEKSTIIEYAKENNISYFEDSSNGEDNYTRNRFRHHIIPQIKAENPAISQKIVQYTDYLTMADDFINYERDKFISQSFIEGRVDLNTFNQLMPIMKIKVLKFLINDKSSNSIEVTYQQYLDMIDVLMNETPNVNYYLKDNYMMVKVYNQFYIGENIQNERVVLVINDFGEYIINNNKKYVFSKIKLNITYTDYFELCYNKAVFPLYLRSRQDGDKMSLKVGTKKVKDILIDQKVEKLIRDDLILLADDDKVLWIPNIKKSIQNSNSTEKIYIYEVI